MNAQISWRWLAVCVVVVVMGVGATPGRADSVATNEDQSWPPRLPGAVHGTLKLTSPLFLQVPTSVVAAVNSGKAVPFDVAKKAPTVELVYHAPLPDRALNGTGWSAWGDIALASDGRVYVGTGDHGDDAGGKSRAYLFCWDPKQHQLQRVVDLNAITPRTKGESTWSKLHARILEGPDGGIYFTGTLNDGNRANQPEFKWSAAIPGGQIYRYDPQTGQTAVFANLPPARCSATTLVDRPRHRFWANLEAGPNALFVLDLQTKQPLYQSPPGAVVANRNFALAADGTVYFNGTNGLWKCDAAAKTIGPTASSFGSNSSMRASTVESKDGWIYGATMMPAQLFRYAPARDKLELLGADFLAGEYTTVCELSPDERFVYYLPGAHGGAWTYGTPVIQYNRATGRRKVLGFLRAAFEKQAHYVPAGTYGVKISADGSTLYVNFNGHAADGFRPAKMTAGGFGLSAFAAIHIPASER